MTNRFRNYLLPLPLLVPVLGCGDEPASPVTPAKGQAAATPAVDDSQGPANTPEAYGFEVWHDDFPFPVYLSRMVSGKWYGFTRKQALEHVVAHLSGACTRAAWVAAKEFFERAPERAVPLLVQALDRSLQTGSRADMAENVIEALGRLGDLADDDVSQALLRALQHHKLSLRNKAMASLAVVGTPAALRQAGQNLASYSQRAQADWVRGVRKRLPGDEAARIYRDLLSNDRFGRISGAVVDEALKLGAEHATAALEPFWNVARPRLKLTIASALHGNGDLRGTAYLREQLRHGDSHAKTMAIKAATAGDMKPLLDDILMLSQDPAPEVRTAVATAIANVPGENVDNLLATMALDEVVSVRQIALLALKLRGKRDHLDRLLDEIRNGTGTRLRSAMADSIAAHDERAIPLIYERYKMAPDLERKGFLQLLGRSKMDEAFPVLTEVFLGPEHRLDGAGTNTIGYVGTLLPNLAGAREKIYELFSKVPEKDYRRRAQLVYVLGSIAAFEEDEAFRTKTYDLFRSVLKDRTEIPQMRLMALEYLRNRDLRLADVMAMEKMQETDKGPMRLALTSFLFEFF